MSSEKKLIEWRKKSKSRAYSGCVSAIIIGFLCVAAYILFLLIVRA